MESFNWVIGVLTVVFGIAGLISNNKKKREEQASSVSGRKADSVFRQDSGTGTGADMRHCTKPSGTFGRVLEELSRQLDEQRLPPVVHPTPFTKPAAPERSGSGRGGWSMTDPQSDETSYDYYSLETEDGMYDWRGYSAEEFDAEQRYVGGELRGANAESGADTDHFETEIAAYERLASQRAHRSALASATVETASDFPESPGLAAASDSVDDGDRITLQGLLGGDFDLRRAVIEAEILAPKYVARC